MDKTGTLTLGEPTPTETHGLTDHELTIAASLAATSRHPYARAMVQAARRRGLQVEAAADVVETGGLGLALRSDYGEVRLGSARFTGAEASDDAALWLAVPGLPPKPIAMVDRLRSDARSVIAELKSAGLGIALVSGDRKSEVARIAEDVGIVEQAAAMMPADKVHYLNNLAARGRRVLMVGDGLNDAPALAAARASLSPSTAIDISQTAADVIFQGEALAPVVETLGVAQAARRMSLQNFAIAIGYNAVFVPLAVVGLVTPLIAAVAMSASSIAVTANALRLRTRTLRIENRRTST
jgi:Cu2+-exporting ATPase